MYSLNTSHSDKGKMGFGQIEIPSSYGDLLGSPLSAKRLPPISVFSGLYLLQLKTSHFTVCHRITEG